MSRVFKVRLGARQVRILRQLLVGTAGSTEDDAVRATCVRVVKEIDRTKREITPPS